MNQDLLTQTTSIPQPIKQQPSNVTVNPTVKQEKPIKPEKVSTQKSALKFLISKTKSGTLFKQNEIDETMSQAGATPQKPQQESEPIQPIDKEKLNRKKFKQMKKQIRGKILYNKRK